MKDDNIYEPRYKELVDMPIHPSVHFGRGVKVGEYCIIEENCILGDKVVIGHHCVLRPATIVGSGSVIAHNVVCEGSAHIGKNTVIHDQTHLTMGIEIGDNTFLGPCVVTTNTRHISHGRSSVPKKITPVRIGNGVRIGAGAVLLPGIIIEDQAVIGAGSVVTRDVPFGEIWYGNPAKKTGLVPIEEWLS